MGEEEVGKLVEKWMRYFRLDSSWDYKIDVNGFDTEHCEIIEDSFLRTLKIRIPEPLLKTDKALEIAIVHEMLHIADAPLIARIADGVVSLAEWVMEYFVEKKAVKIFENENGNHTQQHGGVG